jgi:hypothetical protein
LDSAFSERIWPDEVFLENLEFDLSYGRIRAILIWMVVLSADRTLLRADGGLRAGDLVAICGDSITEQRLYSAFVETYLLACQPVKDVRTH